MGIKSSIVHVATTFLLLSAISTSATAAVTQGHGTQQIDVPGFGPVLIFRSPSAPSSIALYLSPAAGWSDWDTTVARQLAKGDTLVAGVETPQFLSHLDDKGGACTDPASSLEALVSSLRREFAAVSDHVQPMIVGHAEGGMLAYDALAEPDHHTFKGGLAMDFCPDPQSSRPLCGERVGNVQAPNAADGTSSSSTANPLTAGLNVLQPRQENCTADAAGILASTPGVQVIPFDGDPDAWGTHGPRDQVIDAYWQIAGTDSSFRGVRRPSNGIPDIPLTEVRDRTRAETDTFAIMLSGDGGWADLDQGVSKELARRGIPVVGISSLKYFWTPRKPEDVAVDIAKVAAHYLNVWQKNRFLIVGYSFGADVAPFVPKKLPPDVTDKLAGIALIAPSRNASFEFHVSEWLGVAPSGPATAPEIASLSPLPTECLYGATDTDSVCPDLAKGEANVIKLPGDHHFNGNYAGIANAISAMRR